MSVLLIAFSLFAHADAGLISNIGQISLLESSGTFSRAFVQGGRWRIALGSQQKLFVAELEETQDGSQWEIRQKRSLVSLNQQRFNDWAIALCPNDDLSVTASFDVNAPNDSAHHWLVDDSDEVLFSGSVATASSQWQFNDPSSICTDTLLAVGSSIQGFAFGNWLFPMIEGDVDEPFEIEPQYRLNGGALYDDGSQIIHIGIDHNTPMQVNIYDQQWNIVSVHSIQLLQDYGLRAYWPQGLVRHGNRYLVAFMGRDDSWPNGDRGDVFVAVFDLNWNLIEEARLTQYETNAAMRPWIDCFEGRCLVSFDVDTTHAVVPFSIDYNSEGSSGSTNAKIDSCGCADGGAAVLILPFAFAIRRRGRVSKSDAANLHGHTVAYRK